MRHEDQLRRTSPLCFQENRANTYSNWDAVIVQDERGVHARHFILVIGGHRGNREGSLGRKQQLRATLEWSL